jgi:NADP-dependent 3-hydroxy acid dehydrogenase YdfG
MFAKKRNVGAALAKLLASRGASVVAVDTMKSRLEAVVGSLEGDGHLELSDYDLLDPTSSAALIAKVHSIYGRLDGVGTTVGGFAMAKLEDAGLDQWDKMFNLNVKTTGNIYRAAMPAIRQTGGRALVEIGSARKGSNGHRYRMALESHVRPAPSRSCLGSKDKA